MDSDTDDMPILSNAAFLALEEHFLKKKQLQQIDTKVTVENKILKGNELDENWQLSQFWYDDYTATELAKEALIQVSEKGTIALIGCPSLYYFLKKKSNDFVTVKLLDIDKRFEAYTDDFFHYNYNNPLPPHIPNKWNKEFDLVIIDPPFLSEECFLKCALTAKYLSKEKIIICTGVVMESFVKKLLKAKKTNFTPKHKHNLGNEFACFINYSSNRFTFAEKES